MEPQAKISHSSPGVSNDFNGGGYGGRAMPVAAASVQASW
jgi:hypothetical protein